MYVLYLRAEFPEASTPEEASAKLDAFRESVLPSVDHGIILTEADTGLPVKPEFAGHTPRPWSLDTCDWPLVINGPDDHDCTEEAERASVVALVKCAERGGQVHMTAKVAEANARLIVAAVNAYTVSRAEARGPREG